MPDFARALARLAAGRGSPRDLALLRDGLAGAAALRTELEMRDRDGPRCSMSCCRGSAATTALVDRLARALVASPPIDASKGGYIAEGYDAALDALREAASNGRRAIAALEARYRDCDRHQLAQDPPQRGARLSCRSVGQARRPADGARQRLHPPPDARRRRPLQLARAARGGEPGGRGGRARARRRGRACRGADRSWRSPRPRRSPRPPKPSPGSTSPRATPIARRKADGRLPQLTDEPCLEIEAGRHPVVEAALRQAGERFVANDLSLGPDDRLWLITGPNMGGKSTFLRQTALIAVLAQAGSFVPAARAQGSASSTACSAASARRTISRAAARPSWSRWSRPPRSSPRRRRRSLVILDEIGRGTSTYDGLAIAWAVVEAMHDQVKCRTLFATHYHELTRLAGRLDCLSLHHVRAREWKGDLVLLHEVADGAADRSYGIAVAKLAGLPPAVVGAREVGARQARSRPRCDRRDCRRARRSAAVRRGGRARARARSARRRARRRSTPTA